MKVSPASPSCLRHMHSHHILLQRFQLESLPGMSPPKSLVALFTGAMLFSLVSAHSVGFLDSYGEGAGFGPWGVPEETYNRLMDSPNATSEYPLPAPDTSSAYPASGPADGWSLTVSVVADIAMTESDSSSADGHDHHTFTGSRVVLEAPTDVDESWFVCVIQWDLDLTNYPAKLREDDGSCSSLLSEQCIRDAEAHVIEGYQSRFGNLNPCSCPPLREIPSCEGEQADAMTSEGSCAAKRKCHPPAPISVEFASTPD